jgi:hypothetical protein
MIKLKAAFATDNGKTFMERHFGDAEYHDIYEIIISLVLHFNIDKKMKENLIPEPVKNRFLFQKSEFAH